MSKTGYLRLFGRQLVENGYKIVPIRRGTKRPPFDGWENTDADLSTWQEWVDGKWSMSGCGILTAHTPGVDIDSLDAACADHMQSWIEDHFGWAPVRLGHAPKRLLLFRTDEPFTKVNSITYADPDGDPDASVSGSGKNKTGHLRKVEILGQGQQFVAYAVHPDTNKPYEWVENGDPATVPADKLPLLDRAGAEAIVAEFERYAEQDRGWTKHTTPRTTLPARTTGKGLVDAEDDPFVTDAPRVDLSDDELLAKLMLVPDPHDYERWTQVGMALWHQSQGDQVGLDLWHQWSRLATNYDPAALDEKWPSFNPEGKGRAPLTARFIIKLAQEHEHVIKTETAKSIKEKIAESQDLDTLQAVCADIKQIEFDKMLRAEIAGLVQGAFKRITGTRPAINMVRDLIRFQSAERRDVPHWLKGYVFVELDETFYSYETRQSMSFRGFNAINSRNMLSKADILEGKTEPEVLPSSFALNAAQIPIVRNRMYLPGEDDLFKVNSKVYVNSYDQQTVPFTPTTLNKAERQAVGIAKRHFEHLFANEDERRTLLDILAYIVQNPGKRLRFTVFMQGVEEDGKSWFGGLLGAALGGENVRTVLPAALEEKYNSWIEGCQVAFIEDIKLHGHNRFDIVNKLKPLITNPTVQVRRMNTDFYEIINTANFFITSNHKDALPLDANSSRYYVIHTRWQSKLGLDDFVARNPTYYDDLYGALAHSGAMRKWLLDHEVSPSFNPERRAPTSRARDEMILLSKSEAVETLEEILAGSPRMDMTKYLLNATDLAGEFLDLGEEVPLGWAMKRLLSDMSFVPLGKVRVADRTCRFWSQTPEKFTDAKGRVDPLLVRDWMKDDL